MLSDIHLEVAAFDFPESIEFDVAVLAGDIGTPGESAIKWIRTCRPLRGKNVVFVPGNHEYYGSNMNAMLERMRQVARGSHVHLLDGDRLCLDGVRFLGATLWTDFRLKVGGASESASHPMEAMRAAALGLSDYHCIRTSAMASDGEFGQFERALRPQDTARIHAKQLAWLSAQLAKPFVGPTVVVTHHAPNRASLSARFARDQLSAAFVNDLPSSFFQVPVLWVHGHTHACFDYFVHHTRVVCNPRGYAPEHVCDGFRPDRVIEI